MVYAITCEWYINIGKKKYQIYHQWKDFIDTNNRGESLINADVFSGWAETTLSNVGQGLQIPIYLWNTFVRLLLFICFSPVRFR
jgi:hypothetical protein